MKLQTALIFLLFMASLSTAEVLHKENDYATLDVWPGDVPYAASSDWQYFSLCSKDHTGMLHGAFIFPLPLETKEAEINNDYQGWEYQAIPSDQLKARDYNITAFSILLQKPPRCDVGEIHPLNNRYINFTLLENATVGYACLNSTLNLGGGVYRVTWYTTVITSEPRLVNKTGWHDIKAQFTVKNVTGNIGGVDYVNAWAYYTSAVFLPYECKLFRVKYKASPAQIKPKWDLALWSGPDVNCFETDTCAFEVNLDPTFNEDAWNYYRNYTLTTEFSTHTMETVLLNLSTAEINLSCFIPGYDRWVYVDPNNVTNRTSLNFHYYLTNETDSLSNAYWGVALNMTWPTTPVINGTVIEHYYCNNTPVTNNSNGNLTYFYYESWPIGSTFPNHGITLGAGNFTVNATGGLMFGVAAVPSWAYTASLFKANTTFIMNYESVGTGTAQCIGFHTSTNCGGGDNTMWYLTGSTNQADAKAEGNAYGAAFTTPSAISTYPITYYIKRNGSASISYGHDWLFRNMIKTATSTSTEWILFGGSDVPTHAAAGYLAFIAVANTSADVTWAIGAEAPATSISTDITDPDATTYNSSSLLFNITANSTTKNSYTCNKTLDGITNSTNFTVLTDQYYTESIFFGSGSHVLYATCSNQTQTARDSVSFTITSFTVVDDNYTAAVFETNLTTLNMTAVFNADVLNVSASVWFNGTNYNATKLSSSTFSREVNVPLTLTNNSDLSHNWQFYMTFSNGTSKFENVTNRTQKIYYAYGIQASAVNISSIIEGSIVSFNTTVWSVVNNASINVTGWRTAPAGGFAMRNSTTYNDFNGSVTVSNTTLLQSTVSITFEGITRTNTSALSLVTVTNFSANFTPGCGPIFINFTHMDEEGVYLINGTNSLTLTVWNLERTVSRNFTYNNSNVQSWPVCITPAWGTYRVDSHHEYTASTNINGTESYPQRDYFFRNAVVSNTTTNITLYSLNESVGNNVVFDVTEQSNTQKAVDVVIHIKRYFPENNTYLVVAHVKTGPNGDAISYLRVLPTSPYYRFSYIRSSLTGGEIETPLQIVEYLGSPSGTYRIKLTLPIVINDRYASWYNGLSVSCSNTSAVVGCSVEDMSGTTRQFNLTVDQGVPFGVKTRLCNNGTSTSSGVLRCVFHPGIRSEVRVYVTVDDVAYVLYAGEVGINAPSSGYGPEGPLAALLLIATLSLIGLSMGIVPAIIFSLIGVGVSFYLQLIYIANMDWIAATIGLALVGAIIIYRSR